MYCSIPGGADLIRVAGSDDARLVRQDDRLDAVPELELAQDRVPRGSSPSPRSRNSVSAISALVSPAGEQAGALPLARAEVTGAAGGEADVGGRA